MLTLDRFIKEGIHIGDDIHIVLLDVNKKTKMARIGIQAPKGVEILRDELYLEKLKKQKDSGTNSE